MDNPVSLFQTTEAFQLGRRLLEEIQPAIKGRVATDLLDCALLAEVVAAAGNGDHLEIGSLFGGTAILAAKVKEEYGLTGLVVCIDPLDGYYGKGVVDPVGKVVPDLATFKANMERCGVAHRIEVVPEPSDPWPSALDTRRFVSAFIDGWHWGTGPMTDLVNVAARTTGFIMVDNYDVDHKTVVEACVEFLTLYPEWVPISIRGASAIFQHKPPSLHEKFGYGGPRHA